MLSRMYTKLVSLNWFSFLTNAISGMSVERLCGMFRHFCASMSDGPSIQPYCIFSRLLAFPPSHLDALQARLRYMYTLVAAFWLS